MVEAVLVPASTVTLAGTEKPPGPETVKLNTVFASTFTSVFFVMVNVAIVFAVMPMVPFADPVTGGVLFVANDAVSFSEPLTSPEPVNFTVLANVTLPLSDTGLEVHVTGSRVPRVPSVYVVPTGHSNVSLASA